MNDAVLHFSFSFLFGLGAGAELPPLKACALATVPGIAKELKDEHDYGGFDLQDLAYDVAGACAGAYLIQSFKR